MCEITYTSLVLDENAETVTLTGTADDCKEIAARIETWTDELTADVDANGAWTVVFGTADFLPGQTIGGLLASCGDAIKIGTHCVDDPNCKGPENFVLTCGPCPQVGLTITPGPCVNGQRTVHIRADVVSVDDATYTWLFGTDEDNQPGEDSEYGGWLPNPDANGVRVVEVDHVYQPGTQTEPVTVSLVTSSGPNSECVDQAEFRLEPCACDLTVTVRVMRQGRPVNADDCLAPGRYVVEVTNPVGNNVTYAWSVNGVANNTQSDATFSFTIDAGEEKTITVVVVDGGCTASNGVTVRGCENCRDFDAEVRIIDSDGRDVTDKKCLPRGTYTVQATPPAGGGNTFRWLVDNQLQDEDGDALRVRLDNDEEKIVTLQVSRRDCSDFAGVTLKGCEKPLRPESFGCMLLRIIGLALLITGLVLIFGGMCSLTTLGPIAAGAAGTGVALAIIGAGLLITWALLCAPNIGCMALQRLIETLELLAMALGLIALIFGVLAALGLAEAAPCMFGALADLGIVGLLVIILHQIFRVQGCTFRDSWVEGWFGAER